MLLRGQIENMINCLHIRYHIHLIIYKKLIFYIDLTQSKFNKSISRSRLKVTLKSKFQL